MKQDVHKEDRILIEQCLTDSGDAWDRFCDRFLPLVRTAVVRYSGSRGDGSQDVVQDVFIALLENLKKCDAQYRVSAYIWMVAKSVCIDHYRHSKAAKRSATEVSVDHHDGVDEGAVMVLSEGNDTVQRLEQSQLTDLLRIALKKLGDKCREILQYRYFQELSFKEIAEILGANKKSLAVQAGRCIDELKAVYAEVERKGGYND